MFFVEGLGFGVLNVTVLSPSRLIVSASSRLERELVTIRGILSQGLLFKGFRRLFPRIYRILWYSLVS